jgi:hypothetical protein
MTNIFSLVPAFSLFLLASCATIFTGTTQKVAFSSEPSEAKVLVNGVSCLTPCTLELDKGDKYPVRISKEGYEPQALMTDTRFNPVSLLNFIGILPWVVDLANGSYLDIRPATYSVSLPRSREEPVRSSSEARAPRPAKKPRR